ncbi:cytochrome-c3 hydrogenase subunit gamma [Candidatus Bathyarchaeota archaeon ex4484_231]|nr:MAG: cytochrome-c3 hydrogenase subunit gamma [Candidatus Bathyarchaeota archaeon ex4484_231]RJS76401.1 MAG: cytochrome-c3 hydrogenase subunit gamma [Candidatus Bathyarchaeota archaeon]
MEEGGKAALSKIAPKELVLSPAKIVKSENMTEIEKHLELEFQDKDYAKGFVYKPGQFVEVSVMGVGEAPISICAARKNPDILELCVRRVGRVTNAIHRLKVGDLLWIRGPYGNGFPMEKMEGSNLLLVGGGLGIAPLRGVLQHALMNREKYGEILVLYGIRCYTAMLFRDEFLHLFYEGDKQNVKFYLSYEDSSDKACYELACERSDRCMSGVVTKLFQLMKISAEDTYAVICGPPIMYKFVVKELLQRNFSPKQIYMTLERRMKCGVGKCGHCIIGSGSNIKYVCKDGPVFTYWDALNTKGMI